MATFAMLKLISMQDQSLTVPSNQDTHGTVRDTFCSIKFAENMMQQSQITVVSPDEPYDKTNEEDIPTNERKRYKVNTLQSCA